jgi:hypothetical protein
MPWMIPDRGVLGLNGPTCIDISEEPAASRFTVGTLEILIFIYIVTNLLKALSYGASKTRC